MNRNSADRSVFGFFTIAILAILLFLYGTPAIGRADPLDNWHVQTFCEPAPPCMPFYGVGYGNGTFVAVGRLGITVTSPEGGTGTTRTSGTSNDLHGITYGNGKFVAVGYADIYGGTSTILTSPDGVSWTPGYSGTTNYLLGVTYGNGKFVAVGGSGTILTSPDGVTWTSQVSNTPNDLHGITYGNGKYVAVGTGVIVTSTDGITWGTPIDVGSAPLKGVAYGDGYWVVVGTGAKGNAPILTSTDLTNWILVLQDNSLYGVAFGNHTFVAVGYDPNQAQGTIITVVPSTSGTSWQNRIWIIYTLYGVAYGTRTFMSGGTGSAILESDPVINALMITKVGNGSVMVNGTSHTLPWTGIFPSGSVVTLQAVPDPGWGFSNWSGFLTGSTNPTTITMDVDKDVTANFSQVNYTLSLTKVGNGSVMVNGTPYTAHSHFRLVRLSSCRPFLIQAGVSPFGRGI